MRIEIDVDDKYANTEVIIRTPKITQEIEKMIALMRMINMQIGVRHNDETYLLDIEKILYIDTVDRKILVYTEDEIYESDLKLYEIEMELVERDFLRVSKQTIVNLRKVKSLRAEFDRKIRLTLQNGEQIIVSRMYSDELRRKLGLK
ncbi:MAG TPA: LytTR family transcriptional regulator [Anaerolineaceae bacterium]|jgi:two-component system response regulator LytT|nr:LytTR family transcriptional regulator [Anaerolineaceae bacterium]